jgi:hypothetical protein
MAVEDSIVKRLANEHRKILVRNLMFYFEAQSWWKALTDEQRRAIRKEVYEKTNGYHDFMMAVINVTDQDERNEGAVELLGQVLAGQNRLERAIGNA